MSLRPLIEIIPLAVVVVLGWRFRSAPPGTWSAPSRMLARLAPTRARAIWVAAVLSFVLSAAVSAIRGDRPSVHDEFAYLLTSDTFAHGRLTNPTHPLWEHFESFHIFHKPTYQAKYPPGQAVFLAAGQALTGQPLVGVWLSMGLAAAGLCWMLLAWMPPRWALFGALLPALRFGMLPLWHTWRFGYWGSSYWGGAVALLGGALLFGALARWLRQPRPRDAAIVACGLVVLANSRPYEGLVVAAAAFAGLALSIAKRRDFDSARALRSAPAAGLVLSLGALAMGYYNLRVTGDPLKMPYIVHSKQYEIVPLFLFQPLGPEKTYRHSELRDYYHGFMAGSYDRKKRGVGITFEALAIVANFFWGYALLLSLPALWSARWHRWVWLAGVAIVAAILSNFLAATSTLYTHYLAPAACWFVFLPVVALRHLRTVRVRGYRLGRVTAEAVVAVCICSWALTCALRLSDDTPDPDVIGDQRPRLLRQLTETDGDDLVIVRYQPGHDSHLEWVYNGADLENAPVIWARDRGPAGNQALLRHYAGRRTWVLEADADPPRLEPYGVVRPSELSEPPN